MVLRVAGLVRAAVVIVADVVAVVVDVRAAVRVFEAVAIFFELGALVEAIGHAIAGAFEGRPLQAPGTMVGHTDTRWFWGAADNIYRHCPTELTMEETKLFHGRDERISIDNLARLAAFYATVLGEADGE